MSARNTSSLYITGLAHEYPQYSQTQEQFANLVAMLRPESIKASGLERLLAVNRNTGIASRPTVFDYSTWTKDNATPPSINELSQIFRTIGIDLVVAACNKAITEAHLIASDVTHVVAVTCTDQGSPGYDYFVSQRLRLPLSVQRTLLHGVGCAGGLSALREAANLASAASARGRPARVLVFAMELCSLFLRAELEAACKDSENLHIAPALFSDGSAALVVCNELAIGTEQKPIYEIQEWGCAVMPGTENYMNYVASPSGMIATITKEVPKFTVGAVSSMFGQICTPTTTDSDPSVFDWAVHPGGASILHGIKKNMNLSDDHIRASLDVYQKFGNSSSPTVLIVLDRLRHMGRGRNSVIATSFGPGLMIEMFRMRRCRDIRSLQNPSPRTQAKAYRLSMRLLSRLLRSNKKCSECINRQVSGTAKRRTSSPG